MQWVGLHTARQSRAKLWPRTCLCDRCMMASPSSAASNKLLSRLQKILKTDNAVSDVSVRVRFPTSLEAHGSDAMHKDPDYSAAYVVITVNGLELRGHGLTFTLGRGTDVVISAI